MKKFKKAVKIVTKTIKKDPDLRYSYQANIAMAFVDEYDRIHKKYKNKEDIHTAANNAANNFLDLWCK